MWSISDIKLKGRTAFKANYWQCVLVSFILLLLQGGSAFGSSSRASQDVSEQGAVNININEHLETLTPEEQSLIAGAIISIAVVALIASIVIKVFLANPAEVGCSRFFEKNVEDSSTGVGTIIEGFGQYGRTFVTLLLRDLFIALWCLLLVIPGIMKAYSYRMVPYIVKDEPQLSPTEVLAYSKRLMAGNRWQAFLLDLSFIGWVLLGMMTLGIVFVFWTAPYMNSTSAALYLKLREER